MAEEQVNPEEENNPLKEGIGQSDKPPELEYMEISENQTVRDVELPKEENRPKSLTDAMDDATDLTDMQFAASHLFPKSFQINDLMIARVAPEAFLSMLQMLVTNDIMTADPKAGFDVNKSIAKNYGILTIGLEGRGRIDYAELLGAAREIKKEESLLKGL